MINEYAAAALACHKACTEKGRVFLYNGEGVYELKAKAYQKISPFEAFETVVGEPHGNKTYCHGWVEARWTHTLMYGHNIHTEDETLLVKGTKAFNTSGDPYHEHS